MILLIDNYDSFTYNLFQQMAGLGYEVTVVKHDQITVDEIKKLNPSHIVISPSNRLAVRTALRRAAIQSRPSGQASDAECHSRVRGDSGPLPESPQFLNRRQA